MTEAEIRAGELQITEVKFVAAPPGDVARGLLGWLSFVVNGVLQVEGCTLRRTLDHRLTISYPAHLDAGCRQRFHVRPAGHVGTHVLEARIQLIDRPAGEMCSPQHVLKPRVLGRGKHPPGRLQLMNLPQTLHPPVVDQILFRDLVLPHPGARGKWYVPVYGVVAEALVPIGFHMADYRSLGPNRPGTGRRCPVISSGVWISLTPFSGLAAQVLTDLADFR